MFKAVKLILINVFVFFVFLVGIEVTFSFLAPPHARGWIEVLGESLDPKSSSEPKEVPLANPWQGTKKKFYNHLTGALSTLDERGRRTVVGGKQNNPAHTFVFLGCSFTFGAGVNDDETFPHYFQKAHPNDRVLNYGAPGSGPHQTLYSMKNEPWRYADIEDKNVIGVYGYFDEHISRANLTFSTLMWSHLQVPEFYVDSKGYLSGGKLLEISNPIKFGTYLLLQNSYSAQFYMRKMRQMARKIRVEHSYEEIHLAGLLLLEIQKEFYKKFPKGKFYVRPLFVYNQELRYMKNIGLSVLDPKKAREIPLATLADGHFSAQGNEDLAKELHEALILSWSENLREGQALSTNKSIDSNHRVF